jgi:hypothetical protein
MATSVAMAPRDTVAALSQPRHEGPRLHHQLAYLGQQTGQHLPLCRAALGKEVMFFDRPEDRMHLRECRIDPQHRAGFELRQGATTTLRHTPQDTRFVGIADGQLLRCGIGREDTGIGKPQACGDMHNHRIDLVHTVFAQGHIGPRNVGMVPNLWLGVGLTSDEHPRHDIFGQIRLHVASVEVLHQHQHHQGYIQRHIPRQTRAASGLFARLPPVAPHDLDESLPWQGTLELKQPMVVVHIDRDGFAVCGCA